MPASRCSNSAGWPRLGKGEAMMFPQIAYGLTILALRICYAFLVGLGRLARRAWQ